MSPSFTSNEHRAVTLLDDFARKRLFLRETAQIRDHYRDLYVLRAAFDLHPTSRIFGPTQDQLDFIVLLRDILSKGQAGVARFLDGLSFEAEMPGMLWERAVHDFQRGYLSGRSRIQYIDPSHQSALLSSATLPKFTFDKPQAKLPPKVKNLGTTEEVIVAYRDFDLGADSWDNVWIKSRNGASWPGYEPMIACCGTDILKSKHDAPQEKCECGIYAFDTPKHQDLKKHALAWGEVYLWGDVFICESGYRAEYAYPKNIFVRDNDTKLRKRIAGSLEDAYGVPVYLTKDKGKTADQLFEEWITKALKQ